MLSLMVVAVIEAALHADKHPIKLQFSDRALTPDYDNDEYGERSPWLSASAEDGVVLTVGMYARQPISPEDTDRIAKHFGLDELNAYPFVSLCTTANGDEYGQEYQFGLEDWNFTKFDALLQPPKGDDGTTLNRYMALQIAARRELVRCLTMTALNPINR